MRNIVFIVMIAVFSGCGDKYAPYTVNIDNKTKDSLKIIFSGESPYININQDSLIFPPMSKKLLYMAYGRLMKNGCDYTGIIEEECEVFTSSGRRLKKEIWNVNNWDCNGCFECGWTMNFVIIEDDLE
jgi:hypothetical protein